MAFLLHFLRKDDLFCDVGANAGVYTVLAGRAVGCNVIAIEPVPRTFDLLMQNVYANNIAGKVDGRNIGVGSKQSRLHFTSSLWSYNHVVETADENTIDVDVIPLDDVLNNRSPIAMKIDVEGYEAHVLSGAKKGLLNSSLQAVIIEIWGGHLARYGHNTKEVMTALHEAGLRGPFWYDPDQRKLVSPGVQEKRKFNQIFVRDPEFVAERINTAESYEINGGRV